MKKSSKRKTTPRAGGLSTGTKRRKKVAKKIGRPKGAKDKTPRKRRLGSSNAEQGQAKKDKALDHYRKTSAAARDICPLPLGSIDWTRRLNCKYDLQLFAETYLPNVFYFGWSQDQLKCLRKVETVFLDGGMFALAMPRGGGKTAICRAGMLWGTAYGHRRFAYFVGSTDASAKETLEFLKTYWYMSDLLLQDFPEIAYPVRRLENRSQLTRGQTHHYQSTHVEWGADHVRYPCLLLKETEAEHYFNHDPDSLLRLRSLSPLSLPENAPGQESSKSPPSKLSRKPRLSDYFTIQADTSEPGKDPCIETLWTMATSGIHIATAGIDGSVRGAAEVHPITLEQPRPDVVLLDDIQKDQKAESPASCEKLIRLVDGAIQGLAGPGQHIAALMPCTVIRDQDVADTYLTREKKPEWKGERCRMVLSWPAGITDFTISLDTPAGKHWNRYDELRRESLRIHEDARLATAYYAEHREEMDDGFVCSWAQRFDPKTELSAQQHAMNLRFKSPESFPPEYQNIGRKLTVEGDTLITAEQLARHTTSLPRRHLGLDSQYLVAFLDIQDEAFYYSVLSVSQNFTGQFVDYGVWPQIPTRYFRKHQLGGWGLLTREFFTHYPHLRDTAHKTEGGLTKAPLEAKIYHALSRCVPWLLAREYTRESGFEQTRYVQRLGIDTGWGMTSDVVKRYIRESGLSHVLLPCKGQSYPPTNKQLEEYTLTKSWLFEHQRHPTVKEPMWVYRPNPDGEYYLNADGDRGKDFLFKRFASPPGSAGSITLFQDTPEAHQLFADHICGSEYPEPVLARGLDKNLWKPRQGGCDNDYLDTAVGCCILASYQGACLQTGGERRGPVARRKLSDRAKAKSRR